jgi:hypothetical protein
MQRCATACAIAGLLAASAVLPARADEACRGAVAAAFNKQRAARAMVLNSEMKTPAGQVTINVKYQPPDRMHQIVTAPGQAPLETTLYGNRAYSRQGEGPWEELMPAIAQTIIAQVRAAVVDPPKDVGDFECRGTATLDGKEYLAYRSVEKHGDGTAASAPTLHRTIYVDPQTGLPALNLVADEAPGAEAVFKGTYTYPEKLEIEDHPDAPLVKMR